MLTLAAVQLDSKGGPGEIPRVPEVPWKFALLQTARDRSRPIMGHPNSVIGGGPEIPQGKPGARPGNRGAPFRIYPLTAVPLRLSRQVMVGLVAGPFVVWSSGHGEPSFGRFREGRSGVKIRIEYCGA